MLRQRIYIKKEDEGAESRPSLYDATPDDADLWFLPPDDDRPDMGLPQANRTPLIDPAAWVAGQGAQAADLARAAMAVGRLDEVVAAVGPSAITRLAALEVEAMLWAAGTPLKREEIGRDLTSLREGADLAAHRLARWALRRLEGQGALHDLRGFLGLHRAEVPGLDEAVAPRPMGIAFDEAAAGFGEMMDALDAHPITRAAFARSAWRLADLSPDTDLIEAATWSARLMAEGCAALPFVPMGSFGRRVWHGSVPVAERLGDHYRAVADGATAARLALVRLRDWSDRARAATAGIKGDSAARVIAALVAAPLATTEAVERAAGISRDTSERLLARMDGMGLVREITGTRRFRLWTAAV